MFDLSKFEVLVGSVNHFPFGADNNIVKQAFLIRFISKREVYVLCLENGFQLNVAGTKAK